MDMRNRRLWIVGLLAIFGFVARRRGLVLDYKTNWDGHLERRFQYGKCFVDGVEIDKVWFVDKEAGLVRSYDLGDGNGYVVAGDGKSVKSRTVRGSIRLVTSDGEELC
jgi:hypothetical protein